MVIGPVGTTLSNLWLWPWHTLRRAGSHVTTVYRVYSLLYIYIYFCNHWR